MTYYIYEINESNDILDKISNKTIDLVRLCGNAIKARSIEEAVKHWAIQYDAETNFSIANGQPTCVLVVDEKYLSLFNVFSEYSTNYKIKQIGLGRPYGQLSI